MKMMEIFAEPKYWCQGGLTKPLDPDKFQSELAYCLIGADMKITGRHSYSALISTVVNELYPLPSGKFQPAHHFNDHPNTTFEMIQAVAAEYDRRRMLESKEAE